MNNIVTKSTTVVRNLIATDDECCKQSDDEQDNFSDDEHDSSSAEEDDSSEQESNYEQDHTSDQQEGSSDKHDGGPLYLTSMMFPVVKMMKEVEMMNKTLLMTMKVFLLMTHLYFSKLCIKKQKRNMGETPLSSIQFSGVYIEVTQRPGPTQYATRECDSISSSFQLFFSTIFTREYKQVVKQGGTKIIQ